MSDNPFDEILKVADSLEELARGGGGRVLYVHGNAVEDAMAEIRAACSPEAVAFWEAAEKHSAVVLGFNPMYESTPDGIIAAYRALVARAKTEEGK